MSQESYKEFICVNKGRSHFGSSIILFAGSDARVKIAENGLNPVLFDSLVGASGGPKWFVLYELDRYLAGSFFSDRLSGSGVPLKTLGSSAGAWRMCCYAMSKPTLALERLAALYSEEVYSEKPSRTEVTDKARAMLTKVLGSSGIDEVVANCQVVSHLVATRSRGFGSSKFLGAQLALILLSALGNLFNRRALSLFFERTVFCTSLLSKERYEFSEIGTAQVSLNEDNLIEALMATGAIPYILEGVRDIAGAKKGLFWDGGIVDYHFDCPLNAGDALTLYPHYSADFVPGWFDKALPWRRVKEHNYSQALMVCPSLQFVKSLPFGKIPDRKDFEQLDASDRIKYWKKVLAESARLAEDFHELVECGVTHEMIRPFSARSR